MLPWLWRGVEVSLPGRREGPSSSEADDVSGGVQVSAEGYTRTERLLEGIGILLSLYLAKAACTASVWTSDRKRSSREVVGRGFCSLGAAAEVCEGPGVLASAWKVGST